MYQIESDYLAAIEAIEQAEGEITPDMETALAINQVELEVKASNYAMFILEKRGEIQTIDDELKRLTQRKKSINSITQRLEDSIANAMKIYNVEKITTPLVTLSFRASERMEKAVLFDLSAIPKQYLTEVTTTEIDTIGIKSALKAGHKIEGFELVKRQNLQIK